MTLQFWKRVRTTDPEDDLYSIERKKLVERFEVDCHMDSVNIPNRGDFVDICGKPHLILARMFSLDRDQAFTLNGASIICPQLIVDYEVEDSTYEGINRENRRFLFTLPALEDQKDEQNP